MDIAKFIEENKVCADDLYMGAEQVILVDDLKELLKTHSMVPVEMVQAVAHIGVDFGYGPYSILPDDKHVANAREILKASQENNQ